MAGFDAAGRLAAIPDRASPAAEPIDDPAPTLKFGCEDAPAAARERGVFAPGLAWLVALDPREDEGDALEPDDPLVSAAAVAGIDSTAAPIPKATARAPTRPTEFARSMPPDRAAGATCI